MKRYDPKTKSFVIGAAKDAYSRAVEEARDFAAKCPECITLIAFYYQIAYELFCLCDCVDIEEYAMRAGGTEELVFAELFDAVARADCDQGELSRLLYNWVASHVRDLDGLAKRDRGRFFDEEQGELARALLRRVEPAA